jgi:hypothetical protein
MASLGVACWRVEHCYILFTSLPAGDCLTTNPWLQACLHLLNCLKAESESYDTTDGQSASLSWNKAPVWGLRPDFYYCQTVAGLLMWGALSDERTGLSFTFAAGPCQRTHSRVRVPWDSRTYFTASDWGFPFSSPPPTRRATVEVFDPASTRDCLKSWIRFPVYSLGADPTEDTSSNSSYIVACVTFFDHVMVTDRCLTAA